MAAGGFLVLYASQTGNAQSIAEGLKEEAEEKGFICSVHCTNEYDKDKVSEGASLVQVPYQVSPVPWVCAFWKATCVFGRVVCVHVALYVVAYGVCACLVFCVVCVCMFVCSHSSHRMVRIL